MKNPTNMNLAIEFKEKINLDHIDQYDVDVFEKSNLDGDTATWIVIATLSAQLIPSFMKLIFDIKSLKKVKKIKVGEIEIENPDKEMLDMLLKEIKKLTQETDEKIKD